MAAALPANQETPATGQPSTSMPSSAFLLARLNSLRNSLLEHFQYIIEASQVGGKAKQVSRDPATDRIYDETIEVDEAKTPSLAQTKMDQVRMDVEVEGLIKKCEDLLALSRVLKEGWIFGGLDTIKKSDDEVVQREIEEWEQANEVATLALSVPMNGLSNSDNVTLSGPIDISSHEVRSFLSGKNLLAHRTAVYGVYQCDKPGWQGNCKWDGPGVEDGSCRKAFYGATASMGPDRGIRCNIYRSPNCDGPSGSDLRFPGVYNFQNDIYSAFLALPPNAIDYRPVRILQTEVRKVDRDGSGGGEIECDTFFPIALEDGKDGLRKADGREVKDWLRTESGETIPFQQGEGEWFRDDKVGVEVRVVGWERR
ncbi:hypothetical protein DV736_g363, partial [Chaetothyriales sp. CBS 134916]